MATADFGPKFKTKAVSKTILRDSGNQQKTIVKRSHKPLSSQSTSDVIDTSIKTRPASRKPQVSSCLSSGRTIANSTLHPTDVPRLLTQQLIRPHDSKIRVTNPQRIKSLWKEVMSATRDTESSKYKKRPAGVGRGSSLLSGSIGSEYTTSSARIVYAKPTDKDFRDTQLIPRSISIDLKAPSQGVYAHFGTEEVNGERRSYYKALPRASGSSVWLDVGDQFAREVVREYAYMKACSLCEAEYATYAKETLLKRDARSLEADPTRPWMAERMIELVAKPNKSECWEEPPRILPDVKHKLYNYDIRPDCSYWLSLQAFSPRYKYVVHDHVYVMNKRITCPYFTIEFKRDELTIESAIDQVATASALALYNRYQLKRKRLELGGKEWDEEDVGLMRHYALTFTGDTYTFWCMTPNTNTDRKWAGCQMNKVYKADCSYVEGVVQFADWVNEIHRWGLTVHGPGCEEDIKYCITQASHGIRTSLGLEELAIK